MRRAISLIFVFLLPLSFSSLSGAEQSQPSKQSQREADASSQLPADFPPIQPGQKPPPIPQEMRRLMQQPPQMSEQEKTAMEREKKIGVIMNAYHQRALSAQEAERDLFPLIKQSIQQRELQGLEFQIQELEKQLEFLKKAKSDPDVLVKKRIDELLGRSGPNPVGMAGPEEMR